MSMESDFYSLLTGTTAITDVVSTRIYKDIVDQNTAYPNLLFIRTGGDADVAMDGPIGLERSEMTLQVRAKSAATVISARDAVKSALNGYSGTVGSTEFQGIFFEYGNSGYVENLGMYHEDLLFTIYHKAAS
jgi:hypothetical protein